MSHHRLTPIAALIINIFFVLPICSAVEVHLAVRTDGIAGSGTLADPFDCGGSTDAVKAGKFDTIMASYSGSTYVTFYLHGTGFCTDVASTANGSAFYVKTGWQIIGDGMYDTTIKMIGNLAGQHYDHEAFKAPAANSADNVVISDLTVDCNYPGIGTSADTVNGERYVVLFAIAIFGNNNLVEGVRCSNQYGSFANGAESFGIALSAPAAGASGAVIRFCLVDQPNGTYAGAPFTIAGADTTHPMSNWRVYGNVAQGVNDGVATATFNTGGVNLAYVTGGDIYSNVFIDCQSIAYSDTGNADNIRIHDNQLTRGWKGIAFVSDESAHPTWTKSNIQCYDNDINLQDRTGGEIDAFRFAGGSNIRITGQNTVTIASGGVGTGSFWSVLAQGVATITVSDLSAPNTNAQVTGSNITLARNTTSTGGPITGLLDTSPPAVTNAANTFSALQTILVAKVADGDMGVQLGVYDTAAYNASPLAGLGFGFKYNSGGSFANGGGIGLGKENTTNGDYASFLDLYTRPNGLNTTRRMRIFSNGGAVFGSGTTSPGAGIFKSEAGNQVGTAGTTITRLRHGTVSLSSGTATVSDTNVTANTRIIVTRNGDGGTIGCSYSITRSANTSFTITSKSSTGATQTADTSTIAYELIEP